MANADMNLKSIDHIYGTNLNENSKKLPKMTEKQYPNIFWNLPHNALETWMVEIEFDGYGTLDKCFYA